MSACRPGSASSSPRPFPSRDLSNWRGHSRRSRRGAKHTIRFASCLEGRRTARLLGSRRGTSAPGKAYRLRGRLQRRPGSGIVLRRSGPGSAEPCSARPRQPNRLRARPSGGKDRARRRQPDSAVSILCLRSPAESCTPNCWGSRSAFASPGRARETDRPNVLPLVPGGRDALSQFGRFNAVVDRLHLAFISPV